jgi:hypothetical protein
MHNFVVEAVSKETQAQFEDRLQRSTIEKRKVYQDRVFGNPLEKEYKVVDDHSLLLRDIPNIYSSLTARQKTGSLQYFIKEIQDIKSKVSKATNLSLQQKIFINNNLEKPEVQNKGYLFVTFATTDQAKYAMLEIPVSFDFNYDVKISLKKENSHLDHDNEFFEEHYLRLKNQYHEKDKNIDSTIIETDKSAKVQERFESLKTKLYGDNEEEFFKDATIKRSIIDPAKTPHQALHQVSKNNEEAMWKFQQEMEKFIEDETEKNFSKKSAFESSLPSDDEAGVDVGRSFSTKLTHKDINRFLDQISKRDEAELREVLTTKNYDDAIAELVAKSKGVASGPDSEILSKFKIFVDETHPERLNRELEKETAEFRSDAKRYQQIRDGRELRKKRAIERRQKQQEAAEENTYFNPFQNQLLYQKKRQTLSFKYNLFLI